MIAAIDLHAQNPTYLCELRDDHQLDARTFEFDVYLLRTGPTIFQLTNMQFGININPLARNGGTISVSFDEKTSQLNHSQIPAANKFTFTVAKNSINITAMHGPGANGGTLISNKGLGTRVGTIRITNSVDFASVRPNLAWGWTLSDVNVITKVAAYANCSISDITVQSSHTVTHLVNAVLNPVVAAYEVTGSGSYCSGDDGVEVGVSNSQVGVTYTLYKDAIAQTPAVAGTGLPVSFGKQKAGKYRVSGTYGIGTTAMTGIAIITENRAPATPTGIMAQRFCSGDSPKVANLTATGTEVQWYADSEGGSALADSTALISGNQYFASQTVNGCRSLTRLNVIATVTKTTAPTGTAIQSFCSGTSPVIANLRVAGKGIKWYTAPSGGNELPASTALADSTHYYASQTINNCESTSRLDVTAIVKKTPAPAGTVIQSFCSGDLSTVANLTATGTAIQWYSTINGKSALTASAALVNGNHYFASQTVDGCESPSRLNVTAIFNKTPGAPTGISAQTFYAGDSITIADLPATGSTIRWYAEATGGKALATSAFVANATNYFASQTINGCESALRLKMAATVSLVKSAPIDTAPVRKPSRPTITRLNETFTSSSDRGNQWFRDGVAIPGATGKYLTTREAGLYHVIVIQSNVNSAPSNSISILPEVKLTPVVLFNIYPNPNRGLFSIQIETTRDEAFSLEIFNSMGTLIWKQEEIKVNGSYTTKVDLVGMSTGVFTVALKSKTTNIVKKVIIMNNNP